MIYQAPARKQASRAAQEPVKRVRLGGRGAPSQLEARRLQVGARSGASRRAELGRLRAEQAAAAIN